MSPAAQGTIVLVATILVLLTGAPVAFSLGFIGLAFLVLFQGVDALGIAAETLWSGLHDFTLVSIPMFIMMGAAIGSSPAGRDLYIALDRWLYRVPGGLVMSNLGACALFAALTGSSPATCAAIGKMGIPEMRKRGYPDEVATGSICAGGTLGILIPPSITFILYGIATETSIGRLFLAGVMPGLMLTALFMAWTIGLSVDQGIPRLRRRFPLQLAREVPVNSEGRAVSRDRVRGDVRALWRHRDALRGGRRRGCPVRRLGDADLPHLEPFPVVEHPARYDARIGDDLDDHRRRGAVQLHADARCSSPRRSRRRSPTCRSIAGS